MYIITEICYFCTKTYNFFLGFMIMNSNQIIFLELTSWYLINNEFFQVVIDCPNNFFFALYMSHEPQTTQTKILESCAYRILHGTNYQICYANEKLFKNGKFLNKISKLLLKSITILQKLIIFAEIMILKRVIVPSYLWCEQI